MARTSNAAKARTAGAPALRTIGVISTKGGAGKTATTINLAAAAVKSGRRPAIIDCDPQASAAEWAADREGRDWPIVAQIEEGKVAKELPGLIANAATAGADLILIDTAPRYVRDVEAVIAASDLVLLVTQPRISDVRGIRPAVNLILAENAATKARVLLTICPPKTGFATHPAVTDARSVVEGEYQLACAPVTITRYEDVPSAWTVGLGAAEMAPSGKAATEFLALLRWLDTVEV